MKKPPAKKSVWKSVSGKMGGAAVAIGRDFETATRRVKQGLSPAARRLSSAAKKVSAVVDPASLGGAVAGLSAGQLLGSIVGGAAGLALGGPVGAVTGAQLGGLTGGSVGLKMGYDVTHDTIHKNKKGKKRQKKTGVKDRVAGVARTVVKRSGDSVGSGAGALSGAVVGTAVAGPVGGAVGAFIGESLAGDFVENRSLETFDRAVPSSAAKNRKKRSLDKNAAPEGSVARTGKWAGAAMRDAILEGGAEAAMATVGALAAGPLGARIAGRAGLVGAKRVDWNEVFADPDSGKKRRKSKAPSREPTPVDESNPKTPVSEQIVKSCPAKSG